MKIKGVPFDRDITNDETFLEMGRGEDTDFG
jgi:hypothetical protein